MAQKELSYEQAVAQIEEIMAKFKNNTMSVDALSAEVARATELIAHCKERLYKAETELKKVIEEN